MLRSLSQSGLHPLKSLSILRSLSNSTARYLSTETNGDVNFNEMVGRFAKRAADLIIANEVTMEQKQPAQDSRDLQVRD